MDDDYMKKVKAELTPPIPGLRFPDECEAADDGRADARTEADDASEISDAALDEAEFETRCELAEEEGDDLGVFRESDYAQRIAGFEFKTALIYVSGTGEIEVFYRRPLGSAGGTRWERIGHARLPNALELRRMVYCAEQRDRRAADRRRRQDLIESLFGPGTVPLVESLLTARGGDAAQDKTLTPRQEAFCRHYLTEPSGTRAAVMAGYAASGARQEAHRLLTNADILQKISALRRAHALSYALDRDSMLDKLEGFFEDAMKGQSYSAVLRALLAQAELGGLLDRRHKATERAEARARAAGTTAGEADK